MINKYLKAFCPWESNSILSVPVMQFVDVLEYYEQMADIRQTQKYQFIIMTSDTRLVSNVNS